MSRPKLYPSDLTDSAWKVIEQILADKRKRKYSLRSIFDALLYITKTGGQWRQMPNDLPPWPLCYYYFWKWRNDGTWEKLNKALVERRRRKAKREASPSVVKQFTELSLPISTPFVHFYLTTYSE
jgi:transposase